LLLLGAVGLVWAIKDSYIFSKPRNFIASKSKILEELLSCSQCLGFWVGVSFSSFYWIEFGFNYILITYPFASSAFCWFTDSLLDLIQESACKLTKARKNLEALWEKKIDGPNLPKK